MSAEILTIGTELLLGDILDTNARTIARRLRGAGLDVFRTTTVGDNQARIAEAIREALARASVVITTGGLGPTVDDPTRQAAAEALGVETAFHEDLWQEIQERFARFGRTPTENNRQQAHLPAGARPIHNPVGTAPGFMIEHGSSVLIALPGVPAEMEWLLDHDVLPYLRDRLQLAMALHTRVVHVAGVGESWVDERIADLERLVDPTVGVLAHPGRIDIRLATKTSTAEQARAILEPVEAEVRRRLGPAVFGADAESLEAAMLEKVDSRGWKLATIERGTGGALASALAGQPGPWVGGCVLPAGEGLPSADPAERFPAEVGAHSVLTLELGEADRAMEILVRLTTPDGTWEWSRKYGGPVVNGPAWAVAMALDSVRRHLA